MTTHNPPLGELRKRVEFPPEIKAAVWKRDNECCAYCNITNTESMEKYGKHLHFDHIIPHIKNGANTEANCQLLCPPCNLAKGDSTDEEGRRKAAIRINKELERNGLLESIPPAIPGTLIAYSGPLITGNVYTRKDLQEIFNTTDRTIDTGIFRPKGRSEIWLFVTEKKTPDRTQYLDLLSDNTLYWAGQTLGKKDHLIINHRRNNECLLPFYRIGKNQFKGGGFVFEGAFTYVSHSGSHPTNFVLHRNPS